MTHIALHLAYLALRGPRNHSLPTSLCCEYRCSPKEHMLCNTRTALLVSYSRTQAFWPLFLRVILRAGWHNASAPHCQQSSLPCLQPMDWTACMPGNNTRQFWARQPSKAGLPLSMTPLQRPAGHEFRLLGTPPPSQHLRVPQEAEASSCQMSTFAQSQTQFAVDQWQSTVTPASQERAAEPHTNATTTLGGWAQAGGAQVMRMPSTGSSQHRVTFATPPAWEAYARATNLTRSPAAGVFKRAGQQFFEEESSGSNHITPILAQRPKAQPSKKRKIAECDDLELRGMASSFSFRQQAQRSIAMESHESFLKAARSKLIKVNSHQVHPPPFPPLMEWKPSLLLLT